MIEKAIKFYNAWLEMWPRDEKGAIDLALSYLSKKKIETRKFNNWLKEKRDEKNSSKM